MGTKIKYINQDFEINIPFGSDGIENFPIEEDSQSVEGEFPSEIEDYEEDTPRIASGKLNLSQINEISQEDRETFNNYDSALTAGERSVES